MFNYVNPDTMPPGLARYSHAVVVEGARRLLFCSGQLGMDDAGTVPADVGEQAMICFSNVEKILLSQGMTLANVVRINTFATDRADLPTYMAVRDTFFQEAPPASTLVLVAGLSRPEFKIEIEVVAAD